MWFEVGGCGHVGTCTVSRAVFLYVPLILRSSVPWEERNEDTRQLKIPRDRLL